MTGEAGGIILKKTYILVKEWILMSEPMNIQQYLTEGVEAIVRDALRATLRNPKESLFMARFASAAQKASRRRAGDEREGVQGAS